jgi:DNA polymerase III epsilon subunit-like protein
MVTAWIDTETCGLDPLDSAPIEIAILVYRGGQLAAEKAFHLNPLDDEVVFHEEAFKVNGISEEQIRSYPPAAEVVPEIVKFLGQFETPEKLYFAGYNAGFDYGQIGGLFFRHGVTIGDLFNGRLIDVLELVKKAKAMNLIDPAGDNKLTTLTKCLNIPHEGAHGAMSDIRATRMLYETIYRVYRGKK